MNLLIQTRHPKGDRTPVYERLVQYFVFVEQSSKFSSVQTRNSDTRRHSRVICNCVILRQTRNRVPIEATVTRKSVATEVIITRFTGVGKATCNKVVRLLTCSFFISV